MLVSLAPMEGVTGHVFRRVHAECFGALDRYYTPFLAPPRVGSQFHGRLRREIDPACNRGLNVVPQLLTRNADEFVWAAHLLADLGYQEVNLNLGCPSKAVVVKGKGAGFLGRPDELDAFLQDVCERSPLPVSVKTRVGVSDDAEFERIFKVFCRVPLAELIVHPRVQRDFYQGVPRKELYGRTLSEAPFPVAYNGDLFTCDDVRSLVRAYSQTRHVMLGRGLLANPAFARMIEGGAPASRDELLRFHDRLFCANEDEMGEHAVPCMKEWWSYAKFSFADPDSVQRTIRETRGTVEYGRAVQRVFGEEELAEVARYRPAGLSATDVGIRNP